MTCYTSLSLYIYIYNACIYIYNVYMYVSLNPSSTLLRSCTHPEFSDGLIHVTILKSYNHTAVQPYKHTALQTYVQAYRLAGIQTYSTQACARAYTSASSCKIRARLGRTHGEVIAARHARETEDGGEYTIL